MLRADIRRLSTLLGEALARHGGTELLELVEQVRRLSRTSPETGGAEIMTLLSGLDTGTAVALTRAFSQYMVELKQNPRSSVDLVPLFETVEEL